MKNRWTLKFVHFTEKYISVITDLGPFEEKQIANNISHIFIPSCSSKFANLLRHFLQILFHKLKTI